jgi:hypothetical protein
MKNHVYRLESFKPIFTTLFCSAIFSFLLHTARQIEAEVGAGSHAYLHNPGLQPDSFILPLELESDKMNTSEY